MKLIYIHIPKTAGTSITKVLPDNRIRGLWLNNTAFDTTDPQEAWDCDFLAGHFTRKQLLAWTAKHSLSLDGVKIFSVVRHPLDQLRSNLSFPFELYLRGEKIEEPWMKDMLSADPESAESIASVVHKHPWLMNLQWQYLISGSYPDEALPWFDRIFIFPDVAGAVEYSHASLGLPLPDETAHENSRGSRVSIRKKVLTQSPLREAILEGHSLDFQLYGEVQRRRLLEVGVVPLERERIIEHWAAPGN